MSRAILFAAIAALGNAMFAYGQRRANVADNPFLFIASAAFVSVLLLGAATAAYQTGQERLYLATNSTSILISGTGFAITFFGFYLLYSRYGAAYYSVYAVLSILTTAFGVGILIYRETFNLYIGIAMLLALLSILLFSYGQTKG